jgi:hypothetical protein
VSESPNALPRQPRASRWAAPIGLALLFVVLSVAHTWPLASRPGQLVYDNADVELNAWIVSWVAHQLPRDPAHLFDANTFYPDRRVLAFSEPLLPAGAAAVLPRAFGASAVLTHNLLLLAGFALTGLAGYALGLGLTGDRWAGLLAGSLAAFGPHTLPRIAHLQAQWLVTLPLSLLALDAVLRRRTWASAVGLAACVALVGLTSGYGLTIALAALGAGFLARADEWWRDLRRLVPLLAGAALLCALFASPVLVTYSRVMGDHPLGRGTQERAAASALPTSFLWTPARLHYDLWSHRFEREQGGTYFPGVAALALAALALAAGARDPRVRMLLAVALAGGLLALGPATPLYGAFEAVFPPARALRDPSRFGSLVVLGTGVLAAFGLAGLRRRLRGAWRTTVPLLALAVAHAEVYCAPFEYLPYGGPSAVYGRLAAEPGAKVLAEFPFFRGESDHLNAAYVLASTEHWAALVNGYSGGATRAYEERALRLSSFPDPPAIEELQRLGVTHVIVHPARYKKNPRRRALDFMEAWPAATLLATGPSGERLYRLP